MVCREGVNKKIFAGMALIFDGIVGNISKRGGLDKKGVEKNKGGVVNLKETMKDIPSDRGGLVSFSFFLEIEATHILMTVLGIPLFFNTILVPRHRINICKITFLFSVNRLSSFISIFLLVNIFLCSIWKMFYAFRLIWMV